MQVALKEEVVVSLWQHLQTRKYEVMHIRRRYKTKTLLGGIAIVEDKIIGIFSCAKDYFEFKVARQKGKLVIEVMDSFSDVKSAKHIEKYLANYILSRIHQEQEMDKKTDIFSPPYKDGEIYLRRRKSSVFSHAANKKRSAKSGLVADVFAERLASLNLVLRFKPKL